MKANVPKRKVFQDAVDLISPETVNVVDNGKEMISVEKIVPFHNHPFRLYEGKRLDDMVESIKEHGVLIPVIVKKIADGYEMLSGHNRWNLIYHRYIYHAEELLCLPSRLALHHRVCAGYAWLL